MRVKERIISLKLIEKRERYTEFFDEIGVIAILKENEGILEEQEKKVVQLMKTNYDQVDSKWQNTIHGGNFNEESIKNFFISGRTYNSILSIGANNSMDIGGTKIWR